MDRVRALWLAEEAQRRLAAVQRRKVRTPFPKQDAFVEDQSRRVVAVCGRRGGKSYGVAEKHLKVGQQFPGTMCPILELTRTAAAAKAMWAALKFIDQRDGLGCSFNEQQMTGTLPNGTIIPILGANQVDLTERLRGWAFPIVSIDECGSFRPSLLSYLLNDVLTFAMLDYDGQLVLTGTPSRVPVGLFWAWDNETSGVSRHHWNVFDNPHIPNAEQWMERSMREYGWAHDDPWVQRELYGRWVYDSDGQVYKFDPDRNRLASPPDLSEPGWRYHIGLDLGYNDATAFVVLRSKNTGPIEVVESWSRAGMIPSAVAAEAERMLQRYPGAKLVADTGGLGKGYVEEMRQRFQIPVTAAKKTDKFAYIEYQNGDWLSGRLKVWVPANQALCEELQMVQWEDKDHQKIDTRVEDHLTDALLYAHRAARSGLVETERLPPRRGDREYAAWLEQKILDEDERAVLEGETQGSYDW